MDKCADCEQELAPKYCKVPRLPCPHCGSTKRNFSRKFTATATATATASWALTPGNAFNAKVLDFEDALQTVRAESGGGNGQVVQRAIKRALEALHALNDTRAAGEWSYANWSQRHRELWNGHRAARNVAHHQRSTIITLSSDGAPGARCRWAISPSALDDLRGDAASNGADDYRRLMHGQPVLADFEELGGLLQAAVAEGAPS